MEGPDPVLQTWKLGFRQPLQYGSDTVLAGDDLGARDSARRCRCRCTKRIGWHTFRRTIATLLLSSGADIKVAQELMRHASPVMTLGTYAQAISDDKRLAQGRVSELFELQTGEGNLAVSA